MSTYAKLQQSFTELQPHFLKAEFVVKNCNPNSKLTAFPHLPFSEALEASGGFLGNMACERTERMYQKIEDKLRGVHLPLSAIVSKDSATQVHQRDNEAAASSSES